MFFQRNLQVATGRRGTYEITREIQSVVNGSGINTGLCHVFIQHTSASLIVCENADPTVRQDLEDYLVRTVPDGDALYAHSAEGPDDMSAHIRSILTQTDLTVPVNNGRLALGTWQGVFIYEHRYRAGSRRIVVTIHGDTGA
jgi:secondary thiamine-phosphate synthase enzyme